MLCWAEAAMVYKSCARAVLPVCVAPSPVCTPILQLFKTDKRTRTTVLWCMTYSGNMSELSITLDSLRLFTVLHHVEHCTWCTLSAPSLTLRVADFNCLNKVSLAQHLGHLLPRHVVSGVNASFCQRLDKSHTSTSKRCCSWLPAVVSRQRLRTCSGISCWPLYG